MNRLGILQQIAACPSCASSELVWQKVVVECRTCKTAFAVTDDVPVMLAGEPPQREMDIADPGLLQDLPAPLHRLADRSRRFVRPALTHRSKHTRSLVREFLQTFSAESRVLNVGAGASDFGSNVVNLDLAPTPGIHVVGLAERLPFQEGVFHGVVFQAVLEHVTDSRRALSEIRRVLRPGGAVLIEVPFIQGYHPAPADHRRYTERGLRVELEQHGFVVDRSGVAVGPASAMAWVTAEFLALLLSGRSRRIYRFARVVTDWIAWPIKWADAWLDTHQAAHVIASGVWAKAHRPEIDEVIA